MQGCCSCTWQQVHGRLTECLCLADVSRQLRFAVHAEQSENAHGHVLWASMVMLEAILLVVQASSKVNLSVGLHRSFNMEGVGGDEHTPLGGGSGKGEPAAVCKRILAHACLKHAFSSIYACCSSRSNAAGALSALRKLLGRSSTPATLSTWRHMAVSQIGQSRSRRRAAVATVSQGQKVLPFKRGLHVLLERG